MSNIHLHALNSYFEHIERWLSKVSATARHLFISGEFQEFIETSLDIYKSNIKSDANQFATLMDPNANNYETFCQELASLMNLDIRQGYPIKQATFERLNDRYIHSKEARERVFFNKKFQLFLSCCVLNDCELALKSTNLSDLTQEQALKIGMLVGESAGSIDLHSRLISEEMVLFYHRAGQSILKKADHDKRIPVFEEAVSVATKMWSDGSVLNHMEMAEHLKKSNRKYSKLSLKRLAGMLIEPAAKHHLAVGVKGYKKRRDT